MTRRIYFPRSFRSVWNFVRFGGAVWLMLFCAASLVLGQANPPPNDADIRTLKLGEPIERELAGGQSHTYQVTLSKDQYLNTVVEQRGIDVVVTLFGPDGKQIFEFDSELRIQGLEKISQVAEVAGSFQLMVRAIRKEVSAGRYEIRLVELRTATEQERTLQEARKLFAEGERLRRAGKPDDARPLVERSLEMREQVLGTEHLDVAETLNRLAVIYVTKNEFAKAEPLYQRALAIREKSLGADHLFVTNSLENLAHLHRLKGDYDKAEPLYQRALSIREKVLGPDHLAVGNTLRILGFLYISKGDYAKAEPTYQSALAIFEKAWGRDHLELVSYLDGLGSVYHRKGELTKAELFYQRALAIREKKLGLDHPEVALSLNKIGEIYRLKADGARAEPLQQRALVIREKALGPEHLDVALSLDYLAFTYGIKGDYAKAEPLFQRALVIREKALGLEHSELASSLAYLGDLYLVQSDYDKAEPFYQRALAVLEKNLGPEHPELAEPLDGLGSIYSAKGDYAKAVPIHIRALAIREKAFGPDNIFTIRSLDGLGKVYLANKEYAKAEPLYQRGLVICEKFFGPYHPQVVLGLNILANLYRIKGEMARSLNFQSRANMLSERNLALNLATGSERQKLAYLATFSEESSSTISLHVGAMRNNASARNQALTIILQRKGRVLDAMTDSIAALRRRASADDQTLLDQLQETNAQLARLVLNGPQSASPAEHQAKIKNLEEQKERLEGDISRRSGEFRAQVIPVTVEAVQAAIPDQAALVEFKSYRPFNTKYKRADEQFGAPHYVAYVLHQRGESQWVELGEAKVIDEAIEKLRQALRNGHRWDVRRLARAVDEKVMRPVRALLGQTRFVFISPDGALNLIPFAALVDEHDRYLVEQYTFSYLTSGRDLLRLQFKQPNRQEALVVANPDFGEKTKTGSARQRGLQYRSGKLAATGEGSVLADYYFPPLPGTADQARALKAILKDATVLTQARATEAALKQVSSPRILHITTHGFFLENQQPVSEGKPLPGAMTSAPVTGLIENPLLRSGLALAGANLDKGSAEDDGILTAQEAAGLDLWGTKLVVLAACDTGVGEVKNGEGVYGLRRALVLAGSETQVMSLWPVSDMGTRDLMIEYYQRLLEGQGRSEALRQVQLRMLNFDSRTLTQSGTKRLNRKATPKKYTHPFYWASFIQSGEWANLQGQRKE
jgi:CHAT domain-containing protein